MKPISKYLVIVCLIVSGLTGLIVSLYLHRPATQVQTIQTFHYPELFTQQLKGDKHAGEKIFRQFCTSCHGKTPIIDVVAPRIGDKAAWLPRRKLGLKILLNITTSGVGAMPARGGCFECSDEQLQAAIVYILHNSN